VRFFHSEPPLRNALYRNNRDGTFTDVTEKAGVARALGQGVCVGDYDGDGFADLYVTQYGRSILYHNNGNGTFSDVTEKAGVAAPGWASSAVWFDYDNDGRLDLFVGRFVDFSKELNKPAESTMTAAVTIAFPKNLFAMPSWLFHNNVMARSPMSARRPASPVTRQGMGVVATDIKQRRTDRHCG